MERTIQRLGVVAYGLGSGQGRTCSRAVSRAVSHATLHSILACAHAALLLVPTKPFVWHPYWSSGNSGVAFCYSGLLWSQYQLTVGEKFTPEMPVFLDNADRSLSQRPPSTSVTTLLRCLISHILLCLSFSIAAL